MKIERFQYHNKALQWELEPVSFSDLTLLVGISGVGKTQILQALLNLKRIAEGKSRNGIEWNVEFSTIEGHKYQWTGEFETQNRIFSDEVTFLPDNDEGIRDKPAIIAETLVKDGATIVTRTPDDIFFLGEKTPKLSPSSSSISLLSEEDSIQPASNAFRRIIYSDQSVQRSLRVLDSKFDKLAAKYDTLTKIRESDLDTQTKLALVYRNHEEVFGRIKNRFLDIFPQVTDIKIEPRDNSEDMPAFFADIPIFQIREDGVKNWIEQDKISSGMLRTIIHVAEMYLWPDGTVILIDEFENSLGVNCIDVITEDLLLNNRRLQFILTSHHPYIINNIGTRYWKVVTRKGGIVTAHDASSLGLGESSHDAFMQLINSDKYRDGING